MEGYLIIVLKTYRFRMRYTICNLVDDREQLVSCISSYYFFQIIILSVLHTQTNSHNNLLNSMHKRLVGLLAFMIWVREAPGSIPGQALLLLMTSEMNKYFHYSVSTTARSTKK